MEPVRVLQVVVSMDVGGIETMLMNYYRNVDRAKVQFDFLLHCRGKSFYEDEIARLGGKIYRVPSYRPKEHIRYLRALKRFFAEHGEYKVVHSHIKFYGMYVLKAAKRAGVPVRIAHSHSAAKFWKLNYSLPFRIRTRVGLKGQYTRIFACSPEAAEYMAPGQPFEIMSNAVDSAAFAFDARRRAEARAELGITDELLVGNVGRFADEKNHAFLLDIFARLAESCPKARLLLVGTGKLLDDMKAKAAAYRIADRVIFAGLRKDVASLLCAMDVFVLPSKFEGFPVALAEAQACDLPCFISDTFPKSAVVSDRVYIMSLNDPPRLWAEKIAAVDTGLPRRDRRELMEKAGLDIRSNASKLQKFYLEAYADGE